MKLYVVVIFGAPEGEWCDLNHDPLKAIGPFDTQRDAADWQERLPDWQRPHVIILEDPKAAIKIFSQGRD